MDVIYENNNIVVKASPIEGYGVFAKRSFKKGETVLNWNPKRLTEEEKQSIPKEERRYINTLADGTPALMQIPERYVNSSDDPNTSMINDSDVAIRDIVEGEEITSQYPLDED